jgi:transglutaminase-like putative cysteine protease
MIYRVEHETVYDYPRDVSLSHNLAHLTARACATQTRLYGGIELSVPPAVSVDQVDAFGNPMTFFTIQEPHRRLTVHARNVVQVHPPKPPEAALSPPWEEARHVLRTRRDRATLDAYQFTFDSPLVRRAGWQADYASRSFPPGRPLLEAVTDLMHRLHGDFAFDASATSTGTSLAEFFKLRRGVCQDFTHLQIACLRSLGLAARYVSGYLLTTPPAGQPRLVGADASHAWLSVYCPESGWVDYDPTNDQLPSDKHVILAWGRDFDDVSPVKGVILGGGRHSVEVAVDVVSLDDPESHAGRWN